MRIAFAAIACLIVTGCKATEYSAARVPGAPILEAAPADEPIQIFDPHGVLSGVEGFEDHFIQGQPRDAIALGTISIKVKPWKLLPRQENWLSSALKQAKAGVRGFGSTCLVVSDKTTEDLVVFRVVLPRREGV